VIKSVAIKEAVAAAAARLAATSGTPRLDAELLMAHALGSTREALLLGRHDGDAPAGFAALVERRLAYEPVAYMIGCKEFWTIELDVSPAVLIPRPDSETLIEAAIKHFGVRSPARILDLGTGSGALLLAALAHWPGAEGLGIDMSAAALDVARDNARKLGLAARADFALRGWETGSDGAYDLVLCNPPYIALDETLPRDVVLYEPRSALFAGADGLDDYRAIAALLRLPAGGVACVEIGASQGVDVSALFGESGFGTRVVPDLAGHDRCVVITPVR
jgi:release factor glutamine methyltransferase